MWRFAETRPQRIHTQVSLVWIRFCSRKAILDKCILLVIWIFDLIFSFEMKIRKSWLFWIWFCDFYQLLLSFITVGRFKVQAKSDVKLWQKSWKFDILFTWSSEKIHSNYVFQVVTHTCLLFLILTENVVEKELIGKKTQAVALANLLGKLQLQFGSWQTYE